MCNVGKSCVQHVRGQWVPRGTIVHSRARALWTSCARKKSSTKLSPAFTGLHTQIIHRPLGKTTEVKPDFSALSTPPTTTTTTYIHIIKKEGMLA